jgi:hypothetical protein
MLVSNHIFETASSCKILFMLGGIILDRVDTTVMDSRMSFSKHIDVTIGKALAMLGFLKRLSSGILILLGPFMSHLSGPEA